MSSGLREDAPCNRFVGLMVRMLPIGEMDTCYFLPESISATTDYRQASLSRLYEFLKQWHKADHADLVDSMEGMIFCSRMSTVGP